MLQLAPDYDTLTLMQKLEVFEEAAEQRGRSPSTALDQINQLGGMARS